MKLKYQYYNTITYFITVIYTFSNSHLCNTYKYIKTATFSMTYCIITINTKTYFIFKSVRLIMLSRDVDIYFLPRSKSLTAPKLVATTRN